MPYMGKTIKNDSVVVKFSEFGPDFYLVCLIILIAEDDFLIVSKQITDVYLNEHVNAYRVHRTVNFYWDVLRKNVVENAVISYTTNLVMACFT